MPMNDWRQIAIALLELYVVLGIMVIGFGVMFAGKHGGSRVAHVYFAGSLSWTIAHVRALITTVLATLWHLVAAILQPIAHALVRALHWLATRKAGWLQPSRARRSAPARGERERRSWPAATQLLAAIKTFAIRYCNCQSLPFLLILFCVVLAIFVVCFFMLRGALPAHALRLRAIVLAILVLASPAAAQTVALQAEQHFMFRTTIVLNGRVNTRAVIDTGATFLTLCDDLANRLGLPLGPSIRMMSPVGPHDARRTNVYSIRIGAIELYNIEAVVKPAGAPCDQVLVGMSVLRKLDFMMLQDDVLTLGMR
jgi:clan AA aspartic protease (TIGR02281 family)